MIKWRNALFLAAVVMLGAGCLATSHDYLVHLAGEYPAVSRYADVAHSMFWGIVFYRHVTQFPVFVHDDAYDIGERFLLSPAARTTIRLAFEEYRRQVDDPQSAERFSSRLTDTLRSDGCLSHLNSIHEIQTYVMKRACTARERAYSP